MLNIASSLSYYPVQERKENRKRETKRQAAGVKPKMSEDSTPSLQFTPKNDLQRTEIGMEL